MKKTFIILFAIAGFAALTYAQTATMPTTQTASRTALSGPNPMAAPTTQLTRATTRPSGDSTASSYNNNNNNRRFDRRSRSDTGRNTDSTSDATPQPRTYSRDFQVVLDRSIFIKGNKETPLVTDDPGPIIPRDFVAQAERSMVFNGVTAADAAVAMVENLDTHEILKLRVGDNILRGKVTAISLDYLDYQVGGRVTRIEFGHTFSGGIPETILGAITSPAATGTTTTQPATNLPPTRQLGESIEDYMRRRRAMGL
jgi:hypothetical protein